jgi:hypothetical protein
MCPLPFFKKCCGEVVGYKTGFGGGAGWGCAPLFLNTLVFAEGSIYSYQLYFRTECNLEKSGISVAPPKRTHVDKYKFVSGSAAGSSLAAPSDFAEPLESGSGTNQLSHIKGEVQHLIMEAFDIPVHLTHREKVSDLCVA